MDMELGRGQLPRSYPNIRFYHAKEKLVLFANHQFKDDAKRKSWVKDQSDLLLDNGVEKIMAAIKKIKPRNEESKTAKQKLLNLLFRT